MQVKEAQIELVKAVAHGPACQGQDGVAAVRRAVNYACLSKGFSAAQPEDATEDHGPFFYKLHSVPVTVVSSHARRIMDSHGYQGQSLNDVLQLADFR